jgi:hypothetical protein
MDAFLDLAGATWRKSTHSVSGANCVEVAFLSDAWRKSSHSTASSNCVEVALQDAVVGVRDSKDPEGGVLMFSAGRWADFVGGLMRVG